MISNWIWEENFWPVLNEIANLIEYDFDENDQAAIGLGLKKTDNDKNIWFDYEFHGNEVVRFTISNNLGSCVCTIEIEASSKVEKLIDYLLYIAQTYWIKYRQ